MLTCHYRGYSLKFVRRRKKEEEKKAKTGGGRRRWERERRREKVAMAIEIAVCNARLTTRLGLSGWGARKHGLKRAFPGKEKKTKRKKKAIWLAYLRHIRIYVYIA